MDSLHGQMDTWVESLPSRWPAEGASVRSGSVVYRLSGEGGGIWHAKVVEGKLTSGPGEVADPTAVIECSTDDWLAIHRGELNPEAAYLTGRLRVLGDTEFVIKFHSLLEPTGEGGGPVSTDTAGWYRFRPLPIDYGAAAGCDASDLLDAPAGRYGFLTVQEDRFVFEDGTPIRFWGTNIVAGNVFMDHETARRTAARLARFGCNMVRLHHMDADWARPNIFDPSRDDTQHFSAESLDRLDYLISQLKQHGIYVYLDLLVHRKFRAGDDVRDWQQLENGAKVAAHFNPRLIELQKVYARDLYTHVNPYTGVRYCDDPAIAMSEIINESSLFWEGGYGSLPPSYLAELDQRYQEWARGRGLKVTEGASVREGLRRQDPQTLAFLYHLQVAYFTEMRDYLRSLGVKVPLAGSNHWEAMALDLKSNLVMDYLDRHSYWDHPQGGYGPDARFSNQPMVKGEGWNLPLWLGAQQALGKPLIISEWNCCWINEYIAEGPLTMAAYGAYQGWDGLLQFDYAGADWADEMGGSFDVGNKPHVLATWPAAARLFLKGHLRPGALLSHQLDAEAVARGLEITAGLPDRAPLRRRVAFAFAPTGGARPAELPRAEGPSVTDTGEVIWDSGAGLITVSSPSSVARVGFASGPVRLGPVTFEVTPEFAVVTVTALDDEPIARSRHLLITATARAENSGMVWGLGKTTARDAGRAPILMEPVRGKITIAVEEPTQSVAAWALDAAGARHAPVALTREGSSLILPLAADSFWYEVVVS